MTYHPRMRGLSLVVVVALCAPALADRGPLVQPFVSVDAPTLVLINARVIDGTGAAPKERRTILVRDGRVVTFTPNKIPVPARAKIIDLDGNPARDIHDIEKVETVFKDGVGYDSKKLIDAVRGDVGLR